MDRYYTNESQPSHVGLYKIKIYHMDDDEFRGKVYPFNFIDFLRYKWFTK